MANSNGKNRELTKRAKILLEVQECVNRDDYEYFDEYLIIGGSLDDLLEHADRVEQGEQGEQSNNLRRSKEILQGIKEATSDIPRVRGRRWARMRASLERTRGLPSLKGLARLEGVGAGNIADAFREAADLPVLPGSFKSPYEQELDELDAAFAEEVLARLPKIIKRVSGLAHLDVQGAPSERVRQCFEEAHRCYLYGFRVACAVLCRAIVESAIEDISSPRAVSGKAPVRFPEGTEGDPRIYDLIEAAKKRRILTEYGAACAHDVRMLGNAAAHSDSQGRKFTEISKGERAREVLDKTRIVLEELGQVKTK